MSDEDGREPLSRAIELGLTEREFEVLVEISMGRRSLSSVARALRPPISPRTVEVHVSNIAEKLPPEHEPDTPPFWRVVLYTQKAPTGSSE